jgi:hypothetical protein
MLPEPRSSYETVGEKICQELAHFSFAQSAKGRGYTLTESGKAALALLNQRKHSELRRLMATLHLHTFYGADGGGILRCLRLTTGEQVWEDRTAVPPNRWATIHLVRHGERTWLFNERGELIIARLTPEPFTAVFGRRAVRNNSIVPGTRRSFGRVNMIALPASRLALIPLPKA